MRFSFRIPAFIASLILIQASTQPLTGRAGGALHFSNDEMRTDMASFVWDAGIPTTGMTVEYWVKFTDPHQLESCVYSYSAYNALVVPPYNSPDEFSVIFSNLGVRFFRGSADNRCNNYTCPNSVNTEWQHVALIWSSEASSLRLFNNGAEVWHVVGPGTQLNGHLTSHGQFGFAQEPDVFGGSYDETQAFIGAIDEFRVWSYSRSPAQIASFMHFVVDPNTVGLALYFRFDSDTFNATSIPDLSPFQNNLLLGVLVATLTNELRYSSSHAPTAPTRPDIIASDAPVYGSGSDVRCVRFGTGSLSPLPLTFSIYRGVGDATADGGISVTARPNISVVATALPSFGVITSQGRAVSLGDALVGDLIYTPSSGNFAADYFRYKITYGPTNTTVPGSITFTIPTLKLENVVVEIDEDTPTVIRLAAMDSCGRRPRVQIQTIPTNGRISNAEFGATTLYKDINLSKFNGSLALSTGSYVSNDRGIITYWPNKDFAGSDSFKFAVMLEGTVGVVASVAITINAVNDPPVLTSSNMTVETEKTLTVPFVFSDIDSPLSDMYIFIKQLPTFGTLRQINDDDTPGDKVSKPETQSSIFGWATKALNASSQFSICGSICYSPWKCPSSCTIYRWHVSQVVGPPEHWPIYGDFPESFSFLDQDSPPFDLPYEFFEVEFQDSIYVDAVSVYETLKPGGVVAIKVADEYAGADTNWTTVWQGPPEKKWMLKEEAYQFAPPLCPALKPTKFIRIEVDTKARSGFETFDAISSTGTVSQPAGVVMNRNKQKLVYIPRSGVHREDAGEALDSFQAVARDCVTDSPPATFYVRALESRNTSATWSNIVVDMEPIGTSATAVCVSLAPQIDEIFQEYPFLNRSDLTVIALGVRPKSGEEVCNPTCYDARFWNNFISTTWVLDCDTEPDDVDDCDNRAPMAAIFGKVLQPPAYHLCLGVRVQLWHAFYIVEVNGYEFHLAAVGNPLPPKSTSLQTGALIAIIVCSAAAVLAALVVAIVWFRKAKKLRAMALKSQSEKELADIKNARDFAVVSNLNKKIFLRYLMHEMRVPLHVLSLGVESLVKQCGDSDIHDLHSMIKGSLQLITGILNDVSDMQRLQEGTLKLSRAFCSINSFIEKAVNSVLLSYEERRVTLVVTYNTPTIAIYVDIRRMSQTIQSLLTHVLKSAKEGDTINLISSMNTLDNGNIEVIIDVRDVSEPLSSEMVETLLNSWSYVDRGVLQKGDVAGLALSIVKSLTEAHGGSVSIVNDVTDGRNGNTYTINLPLDVHNWSPSVPSGESDEDATQFAEDEIFDLDSPESGGGTGGVSRDRERERPREEEWGRAGEGERERGRERWRPRANSARLPSSPSLLQASTSPVSPSADMTIAPFPVHFFMRPREASESPTHASKSSSSTDRKRILKATGVASEDGTSSTSNNPPNIYNPMLTLFGIQQQTNSSSPLTGTGSVFAGWPDESKSRRSSLGERSGTPSGMYALFPPMFITDTPPLPSPESRKKKPTLVLPTPAEFSAPRLQSPSMISPTLRSPGTFPFFSRKTDKMVPGLTPINSPPRTSSTMSSTSSVSKRGLDPWKGLRVLIVDDVSMVRRVTERLLKMEGFVVDAAVNGLDAVQTYKSRVGTAQSFQLVLMDKEMPVMDGFEATREILEINPSAVIFGVTANSLQDDIDNYLMQGVKIVLTKPLQMEQLQKALATFLPPSTKRTPQWPSPPSSPHHIIPEVDENEE